MHTEETLKLWAQSEGKPLWLVRLEYRAMVLCDTAALFPDDMSKRIRAEEAQREAQAALDAHWENLCWQATH